MRTKTVNGRPGDEPGAPRAATRYATLARLLREEVQSGRYKVGDKIPTEAELQRRFDVSRHTVREALRDLKDLGLLSARAGVGTIVRAQSVRTRYLHGVGTLRELIQFAEATRMKVLSRRRVIADEAMAGRLGTKSGQQWHEARVLRYLPRESLPVASLRVYVRPEHADVIDLVETARRPVFSLIEARHGTRIVEVSQQIVAVALTPETARALKGRAGALALEITRQYLDAGDRLVMASVGIYPGDRYSHATRFRVQNPEGKESR
jgi:DNA-binding GntR family transcriptional regulator